MDRKLVKLFKLLVIEIMILKWQIKQWDYKKHQMVMCGIIWMIMMLKKIQLQWN